MRYFYSKIFAKIRDTTCNIDQSRRVGLCYRFVTYFYTTLTELYLKSTKPIKDEDFEDQFDLKHLNQTDRKKALTMFRSHMKAFSQHTCNLGFSKDIKMKIPVTTEEPHIQKYVPIPHNVRTQVKHILDQMLEFDIIRECNEPSSFCSNLLVTKKKMVTQSEYSSMVDYSTIIPKGYHQIWSHTQNSMPSL